MAATKWTTEQQQAISHRDGDLLVSASAGSGKTAVLIAHILDLIEDGDKNVDLDRLLVATFTNAAADEMRQRLAKGIDDRIAAGGPAARLHRQRLLIPQASISTLDSFFIRTVRSHYQRLDIDPDFRIADEGELKLLQADVIDALFEQKYGGEDPAFFALVDAYGDDRSDEDLKDQVIALYTYSRSAPDPEQWLTDGVSHVEDGFGDPVVLRYLQEEAETFAALCAAEMPVLQRLKNENSKLMPAIADDVNMFERLSQIEDPRAFAAAVQSVSFTALPRILNAKKTPTERMTVELRNAIKARVKKTTDRIGRTDVQSIDRIAAKTAAPMRMFAQLAVEFGRAFYAAKLDRNILDFSDVNHLTLKLLRENADIAKELRQRFQEIIIDEFQDINRLQEEILTLLSGDADGRHDRFMVGDVKQSIYGFRMAEPDIFQDKYERFDGDDAAGTRLDLNKNFRSRPEVLDAVNAVFSRVMTPEAGRVDYRNNAMLTAGAQEYTDGGAAYCAELLTIQEDKDTGIDPEMRMIAGRILELTDPMTGLDIWDKEEKRSRKAQFRDVVILSRAANAVAEDYVNALRACGIPAVANRKQGFFAAPEIRLLCDLLRVIDNPRQDIPLMAVLVSPLFRIDEDRLLNLRLDQRQRLPEGTLQGTLYDACLESRDADIEKVLADLARYRQFACGHTIHELISLILEETGYGYYAAALTDGAARQANIDMLLERALDFESTSYSGIFQFNRYIELLKKYEIDFGEAEVVSSQDNVVRILSIHKSKGLEFPIVILAGCSKQYSRQDTRSVILRHPAYGIRADYIDAAENVRYAALARSAMAYFTERRNREEELRILYVAMTRAREKLILTGKTAQKENDEPETDLFDPDAPLPGWYVFAASTILDVVTKAIGTGNPHIMVRNITMPETEEAEDRRLAELVRERAELESLDPQAVYDPALQERLAALERFAYPFAGATQNRMVYAVSDLKKKGTERTVQIRAEGDEGADEAARRGTAYHLMMAKADPERATEILYLKELLADLIRKGQLEPGIGADMRPELVRAFFAGPLGRRAAAAHAEGRLYREKPFILSLPANGVDATNSPEDTVMVKGVIDCFFLEDDGIVLADYKTDRLDPGQEQVLADRYRMQLVYYADALETAFKQPVKEMVLYSFSLGKAIEVKR